MPDLNVPAVPIGSTRSLKIGSRVYTVGTPRGLQLTLSDGIISSLRPVSGGQYLQITAPISPGSSGGGLLDEDGRLIGLTTFYVAQGQQLNFAIPVEWVSALLTRQTKDVKSSRGTRIYVDWLHQAMALEEKNDWAGLMNHASQWVKVFPEDAEAWFALGECYAKFGQLAKSVEAYEHSLRVDPEYVKAWNNLGTSYHDLGEFAKAIDACQHALRIDPEFARAWNNLAFSYHDSGEFAKAIDACRHALRIDPEYAFAWNNLGRSYDRTGQFEKAIEAFGQAVRIKPDLVTGWSNLGAAYYNAGQFAKAVEPLDQAVRIKPGDAGAWYSLGKAYASAGERAKVSEVYKRLKTLDAAMAEKFFNMVVLPQR